MEVLTHLNVTTALGLENSRRLIPTNYVAHLNSNTRPFLLFSSHRTCNDCNTQSLKQMGKFSFWRTCRAQLRDDVESNSEEATKCPSHVGDIEKEAMSLANRYALSVSQHLQSDKESRDQKRRWRKYKRSTDGDVPEHLLPKVVIVGRPNVGKSALFNRLVGKNIAIVADEPGVTRDRVYGRSYWKDKEFVLVDTGGVVTIADSQRIGTDGLAITKGSGEEDVAFAAKEANAAGLPSMIEKQAVLAVKEASAIIFVVDGQVGVTASDTEIANWLRKNYSNKNIALAVNKCESPRKGLLQASEFWSFGFVPLPISAIAGTGIQELLNCISIGLEAPNNVTVAEEHNLAIAIVGKPNVGKSSILNALLREERTIVSSISGTTRDAIDTDYTGPDGKIYRLIDTAGIRRRVAVAAAGSITESLSVKQAFQAIRRADVVALVIDAMACITEQDCRIAERIQMEGKACIIVVNKWDTVPDKNSKTTYYYEHDVRQKLRILSWAPIVYISATSGEKVDKIINIASAAGDERSKRLGTSVLNQVVQESLAFKQPPMTKTGKRGRIYYCTQAAVHPPTFIFFVNETKLFPDAYRRYMEKCLRSNIGFPGTPIRLLWRNRRREEKEFNNKASATAPTSVG